MLVLGLCCRAAAVPVPFASLVAAWLEHIFKRAPDLAIETTCTRAGGQLNNFIRSVEPIKSMH